MVLSRALGMRAVRALTGASHVNECILGFGASVVHMLRGKGRRALIALPVVLSGFGALPVSAAPVEFAYRSAPDLSILVFQPEPLQPLALLVEPAQAGMTVVEPSILKRLFKALANAVAPSEALAQTATGAPLRSSTQTQPQSSSQSPAQPPPTLGFTKGKGLVAQDSDPNFALWQKMADERLKGEQHLREVKPHPLALAHPGKYVVVCEAGCRKATEEVVYVVAMAEARSPVTRLEPTASGADKTGAPAPATAPTAPSADAAPEQAPDTIVCIAGCYERPRTHQARRKVADGRPASAPVQFAGADPRQRGSASGGLAGQANRRAAAASAIEPGAGVDRARVRTHMAVRAAQAGAWQMRVIYEVPSVPRKAKANAARRHAENSAGAWRTTVATAPANRWRTTVTYATANAWRTKITFAPPAKPMVETRARLKRLAHVQHLKQAIHPIRSARIAHFQLSETRY